MDYEHIKSDFEPRRPWRPVAWGVISHRLFIGVFSAIVGAFLGVLAQRFLFPLPAITYTIQRPDGKTIQITGKLAERWWMQDKVKLAIEAYNSGVEAQSTGNNDLARSKYEEAIDLKGNFVEAHNNLGVTLGEKGETDDAIKEFREATRLKPDYAEAHYNIGVELGQKGETEEAIKEFREATRLKPGYTKAHYSLGVALGRQGKTDDAIKAYREAIRLNPDYAEAHNNLGNALYNQGELEEAIKELRLAICLKPDFAEAHYNLACCYGMQGMKEDALKSLAQAVEKGFDDWPLMEKDEDLNSLRDDPRFKELADKVKARWEEKEKEEGKGK